MKMPSVWTFWYKLYLHINHLCLMMMFGLILQTLCTKFIKNQKIRLCLVFQFNLKTNLIKSLQTLLPQGSVPVSVNVWKISAGLHVLWCGAWGLKLRSGSWTCSPWPSTVTELALCIFPRLDWLERESFLSVDCRSWSQRERRRFEVHRIVLKQNFNRVGSRDKRPAVTRTKQPWWSWCYMSSPLHKSPYAGRGRWASTIMKCAVLQLLPETGEAVI